MHTLIMAHLYCSLLDGEMRIDASLLAAEVDRMFAIEAPAVTIFRRARNLTNR